jgi:hypothetical protein
MIFLIVSSCGLVQMVRFSSLFLSSLLLSSLLLSSLRLSHHLVLCYVGTTTKGQGVRFYLPELKKFFEPEIGDVMLIKASLIQHSTRTSGSIGQFSICMYMQASFFPMWRVVQKDLRHMHNGKKLSEDKLKKVNHWLTNNTEYVQSL